MRLEACDQWECARQLSEGWELGMLVWQQWELEYYVMMSSYELPLRPIVKCEFDMHSQCPHLFGTKLTSGYCQMGSSSPQSFVTDEVVLWESPQTTLHIIKYCSSRTRAHLAVSTGQVLFQTSEEHHNYCKSISHFTVDLYGSPYD